MEEKRVFTAEVLGNEELYKEHYLLRLSLPSEFVPADPGQFLHLRVSETLDALLRRPLSIHDLLREQGELRLLYHIVGRGTTLLSRVPRGCSLDFLGPLGRGFSWDGVGRAAIVAGGVGLAPLYFLARRMKEEGREIKFILGGENASLLPPPDYFGSLAIKPLVATRDGSRGWRGDVADLVCRELKKGYKPDAIYACGPRAMLQAVVKAGEERGIGVQVSLEEHMACGVGACLGCAVPVKQGGYRRSCHEGPVFDGSQIAFELFRNERRTPSPNAPNSNDYLRLPSV